MISCLATKVEYWILSSSHLNRYLSQEALFQAARAQGQNFQSQESQLSHSHLSKFIGPRYTLERRY